MVRIRKQEIIVSIELQELLTTLRYYELKEKYLGNEIETFNKLKKEI